MCNWDKVSQLVDVQMYQKLKYEVKLLCALIKQNFYLLDDGHSPSRKWPWILYIVVDDAVKHLLLILTGKRRLESENREKLTL